MNVKAILPLALGLGVGGMAIKIVVDVVNKAQGATQANMATCVVAKMDIGFAAEVSKDKLQLKEWPKDSLPAQYFTSLDDLEGRVTSLHVPKDVPIYPSMLAPPGTPPGIQTRIMPGYRAVSVAIDEITGVAYQLKPGDRVDVVSLVKRNEATSASEYMSRIILQNVEIAAVGRALHSGKPGEAPKSVARSVTLLLKPDQVTQLHLAQSNRGKISLALRGSNDGGQDPAVPGATNELLLGMDGQPIEPPTVVAAPIPVPQPVKFEPVEPPSWFVKVVSGNNMRLVEYRNQNGQWLPVEAAGGEFDTSQLPQLKGGQDWSAPQDFDDGGDPDYGKDS